MEATQISGKYKNWILNIALIIAALIIGNIIYKKQAQQLANLRAEKEIEIEKNVLLSNIGGLEKKLDAYSRFTAPKAANPLNILSDIARDSGVRVISMRPSQEAKRDYYSRMPVDLVVGVAGYHELGRFVSAIESYSNEVFVIDSVELRRVSESSVGGEKELTVNLRISAILFTD